MTDLSKMPKLHNRMKNPVGIHVRFVRSVFGLGLVMEWSSMCNDECTQHWRAIHCKVFFGPVIVYWTAHLRKSNNWIKGDGGEQ